MSQFTMQQYMDTVTAAQNRSNNENQKRTYINFFKLNQGQEALVRFNIGSIDDIKFVTVHKPKFSTKYDGLTNGYIGVSCLNVLGSKEKQCPFCEAANKVGEDEDKVISKVSKKIFIQMIVRYKDPSTQSFSDPEAVIWERPAGMSQELAVYLRNGSLRNQLMLVTRIGQNKETRYILQPANPAIYKPSLIEEDFSVFNDYKVERHAYVEKTADEMKQYLRTRTFASDTEAPAKETPVVNTPVSATYGAPENLSQAEESPFPTTTETPKVEKEVAQPEQSKAAEEPKRNFNWNW